ncbi:MAG: hypothetical protein WEA34_01945 [Gemmatimonadota bacterium]
MEIESWFADTLPKLDLGPLCIELQEIEPQGAADAYVILRWEGEGVPFVAEVKNARDLRALQHAVVQARRWAEGTGREPLVVVPYLNDDWLAYLREEGVSGLDLSGNGWVEAAGRWSWFQRGFPNRFPAPTRARAPYRGKSAFVGRVLLSRPRFDTISGVRDEIERRQGSLSLGQVSKVLSALEDELVVRKGDDGVRLVQPERLLDALVDGYRRPEVLREISLKAELAPNLLSALMERAADASARIVGYDPARYAIAPEPGERLVVYVEPRAFASVADIRQAEHSLRFANLTIRAVKSPWIFFDAEEADGFNWCSRLETYLQLMQGGKREREIATQLRDEILDEARASS